MKKIYRKSFYNDGKIKTLTPFVNGKKNGIYRGWHDNGIIREEVTYVNGLADGKKKYYNKKGELNLIKTYSKGTQKGIREYYVSLGGVFKLRDTIEQMFVIIVNGIRIRFRYFD